MTISNLSEFMSSFETDIARPSRFDVLIDAPRLIFTGSELLGSSKLSFRCDAAELPGRSISTTDFKIYGPSEKMPYQTAYTDITLTFICGDDMSERKLFDAWLENINPHVNNNFNYKSDYSTTIHVNQYDVTGEPTYSVALYEAFPLSMQSLDLNWSADGFHRLSVTFAYTYWLALDPESRAEAYTIDSSAGIITSEPTVPTIGNSDIFNDLAASMADKVKNSIKIPTVKDAVKTATGYVRNRIGV